MYNYFKIEENFLLVFGNVLIFLEPLILYFHIQNLRKGLLYKINKWDLTLFLFIVFSKIIQFFKIGEITERIAPVDNEILEIQAVLIVIHRVLYLLWKPKNIPEIEIPDVDLRQIKTGKIKIGTILSGKRIVKMLSINIKDLQRHILVYGQTGSGKSSFIQNLILKIKKRYPKIPFMLFEFKGEYELLKKFSKIEVIKPGINFFIDPFNPDIFDPENYVEVIYDSLRSCQIIDTTSDFSPQMEKVLVEAIRNVIQFRQNEKCQEYRKINFGENPWKLLFSSLNLILKKKKDKIPQLEQTIISIKNRLRRYFTGSLKHLFKYAPSAKPISTLLRKDCIIELGTILNLGGSKEDVIFIANLFTKWIWQYNMKKTPTQQLEHITIVEDISYIASRKLLDSSNLTSYLEDIALLLRGKGEALISAASTLEISKNIILNTGTKFFFKTSERLEEIEHYIGLHNSNINFNKLTTGYCLAKVDSIPTPVLLLSPRPLRIRKQIKEKQKKRKEMRSKEKMNLETELENKKTNDKKNYEKEITLVFNRQPKEQKIKGEQEKKTEVQLKKEEETNYKSFNETLVKVLMNWRKQLREIEDSLLLDEDRKAIQNFDMFFRSIQSEKEELFKTREFQQNYSIKRREKIDKTLEKLINILNSIAYAKGDIQIEKLTYMTKKIRKEIFRIERLLELYPIRQIEKTGEREKARPNEEKIGIMLALRIKETYKDLIVIGDSFPEKESIWKEIKKTIGKHTTKYFFTKNERMFASSLVFPKVKEGGAIFIVIKIPDPLKELKTRESLKELIEKIKEDLKSQIKTTDLVYQNNKNMSTKGRKEKEDKIKDLLEKYYKEINELLQTREGFDSNPKEINITSLENLIQSLL